MGEWKSADLNDLIGLLKTQYPSSAFNIGMDADNSVYYVVPASMELDESLESVDSNVALEALLDTVGSKGYPRGIMVWVEEAAADSGEDGLFGEEGLDDLLSGMEDMLDVQIDGGDAAPAAENVPVPEASSTDLASENEDLRMQVEMLERKLAEGSGSDSSDDIEYLMAEVDRLKKENQELQKSGGAGSSDGDVQLYRDFLSGVFQFSGGNPDDLPVGPEEQIDLVLTRLEEFIEANAAEGSGSAQDGDLPAYKQFLKGVYMFIGGDFQELPDNAQEQVDMVLTSLEDYIEAYAAEVDAADNKEKPDTDLKVYQDFIAKAYTAAAGDPKELPEDAVEATELVLAALAKSEKSESAEDSTEQSQSVSKEILTGLRELYVAIGGNVFDFPDAAADQIAKIKEQAEKQTASEDTGSNEELEELQGQLDELKNSRERLADELKRIREERDTFQEQVKQMDSGDVPAEDPAIKARAELLTGGEFVAWSVWERFSDNYDGPRKDLIASIELDSVERSGISVVAFDAIAEELLVSADEESNADEQDSSEKETEEEPNSAKKDSGSPEAETVEASKAHRVAQVSRKEFERLMEKGEIEPLEDGTYKVSDLLRIALTIYEEATVPRRKYELDLEDVQEELSGISEELASAVSEREALQSKLNAFSFYFDEMIYDRNFAADMVRIMKKFQVVADDFDVDNLEQADTEDGSEKYHIPSLIVAIVEHYEQVRFLEGRLESLEKEFYKKSDESEELSRKITAYQVDEERIAKRISAEKRELATLNAMLGDLVPEDILRLQNTIKSLIAFQSGKKIATDDEEAEAFAMMDIEITDNGKGGEAKSDDEDQPMEIEFGRTATKADEDEKEPSIETLDKEESSDASDHKPGTVEDDDASDDMDKPSDSDDEDSGDPDDSSLAEDEDESDNEDAENESDDDSDDQEDSDSSSHKEDKAEAGESEKKSSRKKAPAKSKRSKRKRRK